MKKFLIIVFIIVFLTGCSSKSSTDALEARVQELENRVQYLEECLFPNPYTPLPDSQNEGSSPYQDGEASNTQSELNMPEKGSFAKYDDSLYFLYSENQSISISVPEFASFNIQDNKMLGGIDLDWIKVDISYEVITSIDNAPDCERTIRQITSELPENTLPEGWRTRDIYFQRRSDNTITIDSSYDISNAWSIQILDNGASYFYIVGKVDKTTVRYDTMVFEEYKYEDGITLHTKVDVKLFNYLSKKESLDTTIEQNELSNQKWNIIEYLKSFDYSFNVLLIDNAIIE